MGKENGLDFASRQYLPWQRDTLRLRGEYPDVPELLQGLSIRGHRVRRSALERFLLEEAIVAIEQETPGLPTGEILAMLTKPGEPSPIARTTVWRTLVRRGLRKQEVVRKKGTAEEKKEFEKAVLARLGKKHKDIAAELGVSQSKVTRTIQSMISRGMIDPNFLEAKREVTKQEGQKTKNRKKLHGHEAEIRTMRANGASAKDVADRFNVSEATVYRYLSSPEYTFYIQDIFVREATSSINTSRADLREAAYQRRMALVEAYMVTVKKGQLPTRGRLHGLITRRGHKTALQRVTKDLDWIRAQGVDLVMEQEQPVESNARIERQKPEILKGLARGEALHSISIATGVSVKIIGQIRDGKR
jgi:transposase